MAPHLGFMAELEDAKGNQASREEPSAFDPWTADAFVSEAAADHLIRPINVTQIDNDRGGHRGLEPIEIERAELLPFGHDDDRIRAFGAAVRPVAKDDIGGMPRACSMPTGS